MRELPETLFAVFALALPRGHGFGNRPPISAWQSDDGLAYGVITQHVDTRDIGILVMRRRIDSTWAQMAAETGLPSQAKAISKLTPLLQSDFAIAIADFHAPASMMWSREALIGYLFGQGAEAREADGKWIAVPTTASQLLGEAAFPAGLFTDRRHEELSAVVFTNACAISKLSRVSICSGADDKGLRYMRIGRFFDRTPGALEGIPFCLDITSDEYRSLWPQGYEPWSAELEVFHNPHARHPLPKALIPEATCLVPNFDGLDLQ